ncbi:energy-coupling factor transporter transmembrane component T [Paenibacillus nasutitermitis]|uniref:ABC transporter permease n=1 Tax=Paenibacillus nasutitermitis TaxID=1652958 RepID=A0A916YRG3_9BACL|nr:energy-coupling factor transporter transmembrane component T [Paenibacillus nasutitermitis]GGD57525.1 ABC transporter permease [Paenibacillus nasutitermitis]
MSSGFGSLHPAVCFLYYVAAILLAMLLLHPLFLATLILFVLLLNLLHGRAQRARLLRTLPYYLLICGSVAVLNPLFSHRGWYILFYFMDQPVTLEAILYGVIMMLSLLAILLLFLSFQFILPADKFMYLFSAAAPKTSLLTLMTLRLVPLFLRRLRQITIVQGTRRIDVRHGGLRKRLQDGMVLLRVLLMWSLEEALQTADSMKARGYGTARRSSYTVYRMDRRDWIVLLLLGLTALGCCAGWRYGHGVLQIYPRLAPMTFNFGDSLCYGLFSFFLMIPIIVEGQERMIWRKS